MLKAKQIWNLIIGAALAAELVFMIISSGTTRSGYISTGNSSFTATGIAIGTMLVFLVVGWGTTIAMPHMSWKQRGLLTAAELALFVPFFLTVSTEYSVIEIGGKDAMRIHKQRTADSIEAAVRSHIESASQEERLISVLEPIGNDWKTKAELEAKFGEGSGQKGMGHVTAIKLQIAQAIQTAVEGVKATKETRDVIKTKLGDELIKLHEIMSEGYEATTSDEIRANDLKFSAELRRINDLVVRLASTTSIDLVKAVNSELKAFQGSGRQSDTQGQTEALKDVKQMVAATQNIVNELIDKTEAKKAKFQPFIMVSPAQAVVMYAWEIRYAWAAGLGMDYIFLPIALFFCLIQWVFDKMHHEEEQIATVTEAKRLEAERLERAKRARDVFSKA